MKMDATSNVKWQCLATLALVCLTAQFCAAAALPAPPKARARSGTADSPPITEEELHLMVEQLLMEAYGDEYEPPPPRLSGTPIPDISDRQAHQLLLNLLMQQNDKKQRQQQPFIIPPTPVEQGRELFHQQQQLPQSIIIPSTSVNQGLIRLQQPHKSFSQHIVQPQTGHTRLPITTIPIQIQAQQRAPKQMRENITPVIHPTPTQQQFAGSPNHNPDVRFVAQTSSQLPKNFIAAKPRIQSSLTDVESVPVGSKVSSTRSGIPTEEELRTALLFEQENQPKILIVDRRKKSRTVTSKETAAPHSSLVLPPRNSRASSPQATSVSPVKKEPSIQSARLLSHIVSEGSNTFATARYQPRGRQLISTAPQPFTLPNFGVSQTVQGNSLTQNDFANDELMLLQLLEHQLTRGGSLANQPVQPSDLRPTAHRAVFEDENRVVIDLASLDGRPLPINIGVRDNIGDTSNNFRSISGNVGVPLPGTGNNIGNSGNNFENIGINLGISSVNTGVPLPINSDNTNTFRGSVHNLGVSSGNVGVPLSINAGNINNFRTSGNNLGISSGNVGVPLPVNSGNTNNFRTSGTNLGISSGNVGVPLSINSGNINNFRTSEANFGISNGNVGVPLPVNSGNINNFRTPGTNFGISSGNVGVPLPVNSGNTNNFRTSETNFGVSSGNVGVPLPVNSGNINNFRNSGINFALTQGNAGVPLPVNLGNKYHLPGLGNNLQLSNVGVPLPTNLDNANTFRSQGNNVNRNFAGGNANVGVALPINSGSQVFGNSFTETENQRVTVGDLVQSLDGQNGIRVVSLGDLRGGSSFNNQNSNHQFLLQLRNAMANQNIDNIGQSQQQGLFDLGVGVPLPSLNTNQGVGIQSNLNIDNSGNLQSLQPNDANVDTLGRQFPFKGGSNTNTENTDGGVIDDLLFDATITVGADRGVPQSGGAGNLDQFFVDEFDCCGPESANPSPPVAEQDPFPATFTNVAQESPSVTLDDKQVGDALVNVEDVFDTVLEDNTDYDFGSYENDLDLPVQPPNVFRTGLSDIFFTKGQWIGTLVGGLFDVGSAIGSSVAKIFNKGSDERR